MKKRVIAILILTFILIPTLYIAAYAEKENLPAGFVPMEKIFKIEDGDGTQPMDYGKVDGLYLQLDYVKTRIRNYDGYYGTNDPRADKSDGYTITQSLSDKPYVTAMRNKAAEGFTVTGTHNLDYVYPDDGSLHAGDKVYRYSDMSASITNIVFEGYNIYADISGTVTTRWGTNGSSDSQTETPSVTHSRAVHKLDDGKIYLVFAVEHLTYRFRIAGVLPKGVKSDGVVQNANQNAGEDGGVTVPAAIAVGVAASLAAVAGVGAAVGASSGADNNGDRKSKTYKMYVQKDFGDAIRRGADPVKVRARMAEVDANGAERDRNDLTARITARGDGLEIRGSRMSGRYFEADVYAPEDNRSDRASVIFVYEGPDGAFTNQVIFRLIDGPSLEFAEETPEGSGNLKFYTCNYGIDAIPGDGFTYSALFMIVDAPKPPAVSDISSQPVEGYDVTFEETKWQYVYKANVKNNTPEEKTDDVFAKVKDNQIEISVTVDGEKEPVRGWLTMHMYPEGLTVSSKDEGKKNGVKYVRIQAFEKENAGDLDKKWQVSEMKFTLAVKGESKAFIDPEGMEFTVDKIKGANGIGMRADKEQCLSEKYEYKEEHGEMNEKFTCIIEPNAVLGEPDDGTFMAVLLPVRCVYDRITYDAEVPLRLRGKDADPMADWEKEYKELERRVEKFTLPENKDKWMERMKSCALDPKVSVEELRLVSKWILREYMDYWTTQGTRDRAEARMYNVIVNTLEWTKFAGDCAFSFLVNAYAGPVADALISPAKDFITGAIGEVIAARRYGEAIDVDKFEFSKNLAAAGDNLVSNSIDLKNWRKAAATLSGYFVYCAIKNYLLKLNEKGQSDIWGSLCEAFKDMTAAALKSKAGDLIGKWLKESKKFQDKILPYLQKYFKETKITTLQHRLNDALGLEGELRKLAGYANDEAVKAKVQDVVEKYISSLAGAGFDKLRECYDSSRFTFEGGHVICCFNLDLFDAYHYGIRLDLTNILTSMACPCFNWFYDYFFSGIPSAAAVVEKPKDPPLPPAKG